MAFTQVDGGKAWIILLGINIINVSISPLIQCFGIVFDEQFSIIGMTAAQISMILHFNNFTLSCLGLLSAPILRRYTFRRVAFCGSIIIIIAICCISFADHFWQYILFYSLLIGMGQGILYPATNLALSTYFIKKRSIATGIAVTVTGLGPTIFPFVCNFLLERFDTSGTVLILGAIALHALIGAYLLRPMKKISSNSSIGTGSLNQNTKESEHNSIQSPESEKLLNNPNGTINVNHIKILSPTQLKHGGKQFFRSDSNISCNKNLPTKNHNTIHKSENNLFHNHLYSDYVREPIDFKIMMVYNVEQDRHLNNDEQNGRHPSTCLQRIYSALNFELFKDLIFVNILLGMSISVVSELNFNLTLPFVLSELAHFSRKEIAYTMSIQGVVDILARFTIPFLTTKYGCSARCMYIIALIGAIIGRTILTMFYGNSNIIYYLAALLGLAKGIKNVFQAVIIPDYVVLEKLPAANGLAYIGIGLLSLILGPFIGVIHDMAGSYIPVLHTTSIMSLSCIVLWSIEYLIHKRRNVETT